MNLENDIFSGIPALSDTAGMQNFQAQQTINTLGPEFAQPVAQPQPAENVGTNQAQPGVDNQLEPNNVQIQPQPNPEIARLTQENQLLQQQLARQQAAAQRPQTQSQPQVQGNNTLDNIIQDALNRGYPAQAIMQALARQQPQLQSAAVQQQLLQRINAIEQNFAQAQEQAAYEEFEDKMLAFGNKFGLSENDLVTFGQYAMSQGVNLTQVNDVEAIFRAMYPEQYAVRAQRLAKAPSSQIYGGAQYQEPTQAMNDAYADQIADAYLKRAMPNDYDMYKNRRNI